MTFKTFEEILGWQKAREFSKEIFLLTRQEPFSKDWDLVRQINRSSGSAMDNIAEGNGRGNKKEFLNFLGIAKGSSEEARSQLFRALDRGYISEESYRRVNALGNSTTSLIQGLINYLLKTEYRGTRYFDPNKLEEPKEQYKSQIESEIYNENYMEYEKPYEDYFTQTLNSNAKP